ncbi:RipA family octameric membrane protein [Belliella pelovolcani]|uniref:TIR domain-containing protein n=1 Tax=Belliella pelovolcani TaxID=529505 RepID=A0A1N7PSR2_9BACT|nr:TIR domain-containing protein [Belliella pelovolcani]SIT13479.1 TIR domain-containing protein [Belliella pelovolcani]
MKIFICYRSTDKDEGDDIISALLKDSENTVAILKQTEHVDNWKEIVEAKLKESDFVAFLIGEETFKSEQIIWEYAKAKSLNKQIVGIKLKNASEESILFCQGFQVFDNSNQTLKYLDKIFVSDRLLKIEQYKIMVSSTEKVTDARMKVNNLFFTITSSILSVAFVLGKTYSFIPLSVVAMTILTALALLTTYFWEKLVKSYGKLNTGKFKVIDRIEKELRTNMFEEEWRILTQEIDYEPNTKTETKIVTRFRLFIYLTLIIEIIYLLYELFQNFNLAECMCNHLK